VCHYSITEHVVEIKGALPFAQELIARANHLNRWRDSTQINSEQSYVNENRSSSYQIVDEQYYNELHGRLREVMLESGRFYQCFNKGLFFRKDENWELLRYQESDRFGPHVDCIAGTMFDRRMLTVLAYLNDDFEGGETRFVSPGPEMTVKPEQGKIVMFPPYYTHPHEGLVVTAGTKYAVLGWLYA
jgi:predicted 2-oxoglutarate/Fe(II)-dependent dioxygenase YbiX